MRLPGPVSATPAIDCVRRGTHVGLAYRVQTARLCSSASLDLEEVGRVIGRPRAEGRPREVARDGDVVVLLVERHEWLVQRNLTEHLRVDPESLVRAGCDFSE